MIYYNYKQKEQLDKKYDDILQRYFPNDKYGVVVQNGTNGTSVPNLFCIYTLEKGNKLGSYTWAHLCNITKNIKGWEVAEQFIPLTEELCDKYGPEFKRWLGTEQTCMVIYGTYKNFGNACKSVITQGTFADGRKPIELYV